MYFFGKTVDVKTNSFLELSEKYHSYCKLLIGVVISNSEKGLNTSCESSPFQIRLDKVKILGTVPLLSRKRVCIKLLSLSNSETLNLFKDRVSFDVLVTKKSKLIICL